MKDIKDFFKSSTDNVNNKKTSNENLEFKSPGSSIAENTEEHLAKKSPLNTTKRKRGRPKKHKDNVVISCSPKRVEISVISVDSTVVERDIFLKEPNQVIDLDDAISKTGDSELSEIALSEQIQTTKPNAFQLLMNSRTKVIGRNSPGKEIADTDEEVLSEITQEKLASRKRLFQNWSDAKKGEKRKLEDVEIDECIKIKLDVRKKRFKKLLQIDNGNLKSESEHEPVPLRNKTKVKRSLENFGVSIEGSTQIISKNKIEKSTKGLPVKHELSKTKTENSVLCSDDDFEDKVSCKEDSNDSQILKKKKHRHKHKKKIKKEIENVEDIASPKYTKHWKMRIKLADENCTLNSLERNDKSDSTQKQIEVIIDSDETDDKINVSSKSKNLDGSNNDMSQEICDFDRDNKLVDIQKSGSTKEVSNLKTIESNGEPNAFKRILRDRSSLEKSKNVSFVELSLDQSSDESFEEKSGSKKIVKVAPVFAKAVPKPKIDPQVLEARRNFLMSEMPVSVRKKVEQHNSIIYAEFDVFPKISHVPQENTDDLFWRLPQQSFKKRISEKFHFKPDELPYKCLNNCCTVNKSEFQDFEPIWNIKPIIRNLKLENVDYPVYKSFRLLKEKCGKKQSTVIEKIMPKKRGRPKKKLTNKKNEVEATELSEIPSTVSDNLMWTEKYQPKSSEDFIGNFNAVSALKNWLESWRDSFTSGKRKAKKYLSDSESDFISSDGESLAGNLCIPTTIILTGPCGSGKSASVYAISHELGINVIELNASSRRTGKQVLQELQEATQSHQVRKNKELLAFMKTKKEPEHDDKKSKRMCVLLIEDIDIVFEQDEGFISAISQISASSKTPIILTTSNKKSIYSQKFMAEFKTIDFRPLSFKSMGIWLQILCLIEGVFVDICSLSELFWHNQRDIRKTILELQFWVQSGGQINKNRNSTNGIFNIAQNSENNDDDEIIQMDESSNISLKELDGKPVNFRIHSNLVEDFEIFHLEKSYDVPLNFDLNNIWWNIPNFLQPSHGSPSRSRKKSERNKKKIKIISDMYDVLATCDISYRKACFKSHSAVCRKRWERSMQDSLELEGDNVEYSSNKDFLHDWNHYLVDGCLRACKKRFVYPLPESERLVNMATPGIKHESVMAKNHRLEEKLLYPVPTFTHLDRKCVNLDYLPTLRNIARSENIRSQNNMKRRNRFYNYLRNLNIDCNKMVLDFACNTFSTNT